MNTLTLRKYLPFILILALLAGLFGQATQSVVAAPGDVVFSWTLPSGQINPGQTFSIPLNVTVRPGVPYTGTQFDISFNPAVVRLDSVTWGNFINPANCNNNLAVFQFVNNPTINNAAGTATNFAFAAIGVPVGQGCTGSGVVLTLNFTALAVGLSQTAVSNIITTYGPAAAPAGDTTFPGFNQYVGAAPRLVVRSVTFEPAGGNPPGSSFNVNVTVENTGGVASPNNVNMQVTTDGNSTPASQTVLVPSIPGGAQITVALTGYQMVAGQSSSVVTATIPDFSTSASSTYSPVSSEGQTQISATFGAFIRITPDALIDFGRLQLGVNTKPGNINVKCNTNYQVDVFDRNPTNWQMSEYFNNAFVPGGRRLGEPLSVTADAFSRTVTRGTPPLLITGGVAGQSGDDGQNFALTYSQRLRYADPLLPAGRTYHLVLTFNGYVTQ